VLEKNDFTGGRCSLLHHEGWVCICAAAIQSVSAID
jgi:hypothetical protein